MQRCSPTLSLATLGAALATTGCLGPRVDVNLQTGASGPLRELVQSHWMQSDAALNQTIQNALSAHIGSTGCRGSECLQSFGFSECDGVAQDRVTCRSHFEFTFRPSPRPQNYDPARDRMAMSVTAIYADRLPARIEIQSTSGPFNRMK